MKTGIIIYSITGNTRSVAEKLQKTMKDQGIDATLREIKTVSNEPEQKVIEFTEKPITTDFDKLVFATPVHAFMQSKVMKKYLSTVEDLMGKEVTLFVTHHFPYAWMGGKSALRQMKRCIKKHNGNVVKMFSINWSSKKREENIQDLLKHAAL